MSLYQPLYDYRWAAGHDVALGSLRNVETDIGAHNQRDANSALKRVNIQTQPVDKFPVRTLLASGRERGDGMLSHRWQMKLTTLGYKYVLDTYLSSGTVVSANMTIYTRIHRLATYERYNTRLVLPSQSKGTERYIRQDVWEITFEFTDLTAL